MTASHRALSASLLLLLSLAAACVTDDVQENEDMKDDVRPLLDLGQRDSGSSEVDASDDLDASPDQSVTPDVDMGERLDMNPLEDQGMSMPDQASPEDQGRDLATPDMLPIEEDMAPDMPVRVDACTTPLVANQTFDLHAQGFAGQNYSRAAFDGEAVWVVFAMRETATSGKTDIWATRVACNGTPLLAPFKVSEPALDVFEISPNLAIREGRVYITWIEDTSSDDRIKLRTFTREGMAQQTAPLDITPKNIAGEPISGLFQELDIAALPHDQAVFTASHFSTKASQIQVLLQRVSFSGALVGDPMEPIEEKGVAQTRPSITSLLDGSFYVSWTRYKPADSMLGTPEEPYRVVYTRFAPDATEPDPAGPFAAQPGAPTDNQLSRYSKELTSNGKIFLSFQVDSTGRNDLLIKEGLGNSVKTGTVGSSGYDLRPSIAARADGLSGAVTWYRAAPSPIKNDVYVQRFDLSASGDFTFSPERKVPTAAAAAPPYGPAITHIEGNTYFLSWQEGSSAGTAYVKGRFIQL